MVNGFDSNNQQFKSQLRFGVNSNGFGSIGNSPSNGGHKMSESLFGLMGFKRVLAMGSDGGWIIVENADGSSISAAQAFGVSSNVVVRIVQSSRTDLSYPITAGSSSSTIDPHGPFFHDAFGYAYMWMWTDGSGAGDNRKGIVVTTSQVSNSVVDYTWKWYGMIDGSNIVDPSSSVGSAICQLQQPSS